MTAIQGKLAAAEHFDVLIVGAGISGVGGAYHLMKQRPGTTFVVLEALEDFGGTWLTHTYPGIRSDSDLYTFGYKFKPWVGPPIATAAEIKSYMGEVIEDNDLARHIRYRHRITGARWSSAEALWTIEAEHTDTGETARFTAGFLWMCQGYYRQSEGYTPDWPGMADFRGRIIHPQTWPQDLDYKAKRVIIIGSGATAATLAPAIAGDCAHVTVLQRSPTYFIPGRNQNELADSLRQLQIDESWIHEIVRRRILFDQRAFTERARNEPDAVKKELLGAVAAFLPQETVEAHFTPSYRPWRQRIAFVPEGDIFQGIKAGKASMVTGEIDRFVENGILLKSGETLEADIIRHRLQPECARRHRLRHRRQAARLQRDGHLSGHDVHRHPEPGLGVRLLQSELDSPRGPDRRLRLPPARPHGQEGRQEGRGRAPARGCGHAAGDLDRSGGLQPGLPHARHAFAAQARREARVAAHPGLLGGEG